jgi:hypothetical protein
VTIAGFQQLPFRFGGLGMASTVAHSDIFTASFPAMLAGPGVATTAAHSDVLTAGNVGLYKIAESVLVGSVSTVSFLAIPSTYRTLVLDWYTRADAVATSTAMAGQLNADTGNNYDWMQIGSAGSGATSPAGAVADGAFQFGDTTASTAPANTFGGGRLVIPNYAGAVGHKVGFYQAASKTVAAVANLVWESGSLWWRNTAPITSMLIFPRAGGNLIAGSTLSLYGAM